MKIGYHISISDGLIKTAKKITEQKLSAVQIFPGSPRNYFPGAKHTIHDFKAMKKLNIPKFVHINYFVNLSGDNPVIPKSIAENMIFCDKINADGLVIHMGSHKDIATGMSQTLENLRVAHEKYKKLSNDAEPRVKILIETTAEGGNKHKWDKILELKKLIGTNNPFVPEIKICVDTCHLYSAGYTAENICKMIEENHKDIGLIHLNNPSSNVVLGKHKDQHDIPLFSEEGKFSKNEIENFINLGKLYNIPMVMETGTPEVDFLICEKMYNI